MQDFLVDELTGMMYREWEAASSDVVLLLVHGLGAHTGRWGFLGEFMAENSVSSYAIELEGFGGTLALKGHVESFEVYYEQIRRLHGIISERNKGKKVFVLGESLGGLIAFMVSALDPNLFDGLICISPAFASKLKFSRMTYVRIFLSALYAPRKQFVMPFDAEMCTRDEDVRKAMDEDPREHRWGTSALLVATAKAQVASWFLAGKITTPVLFLLAGKDSLISPKRAENVYSRLTMNDKSLIVYPEMRHALSIELGREKVFADILGWVRKRCGRVEGGNR